jgi:hypothetical protein
LEPAQDWASAPTFSRLEHQVDRKDLYRLTRAFVDHFIASYAEPPAAIVLDRDHSDDPTHGQQEFAFYNHHYQNYCYLPLFIFAGTSHALVMATLRPGARLPPGLARHDLGPGCCRLYGATGPIPTAYPASHFATQRSST